MSKGDFRHLLEKQRNKETHYFFDKYLPKNLVTPSVTPTSSITPSITPTSSITPSITPTPSPSSFVCGDGCFEYIVSNLSSTLNLNISYVDCTTGIQTFDTIPTNSQATYCSCGQPIRTSGSENWSFSNQGSCTPTPIPSSTPTPTPSSTPLPVAQPLQFTVDTSLGDGTTTVYEPEMYRNTVYSAETTDAVYSIDWGDGNDELLYFTDSPSYAAKSHTYSSGGIYTISVKCANSVPWRAFKLNGGGDTSVYTKLTSVTDWGNQLGQIASPFKFQFLFQQNLISVPGDLDTTNIAAGGTEYAFANTSFTGDVTNFVNLSGTIKSMFADSDFNQDISGWDTSNITNMLGLFTNTPFNQNISGWTTSGVTEMAAMFASTPFNQPIGNWDVSNVTLINSMFANATSFNQPLNNWDTSSVTNMFSTFYNATSFDKPLNNWDTSSVTSTQQMFYGATSFNQPLTGWTTSGVTTMRDMFFSATSFNGDITNWDVSNVTNFRQMFEFASSFNQNIGSWNVSSATDMFDMFASATTFNQNLSSWDVSNVTDFDGMFSNATSFNQSLANWNISRATVLNAMLNNCGMSTANYDATLIGWEGQSPPTGLTLGAQGLTYTLGGAAEAARTSLVTTYGWTITGDSGV